MAVLELGEESLENDSLFVAPALGDCFWRVEYPVTLLLEASGRTKLTLEAAETYSESIRTQAVKPAHAELSFGEASVVQVCLGDDGPFP